jgi:hypothetical protein
MPIATTLRRGLPVTPTHSPLRTCACFQEKAGRRVHLCFSHTTEQGLPHHMQSCWLWPLASANSSRYLYQQKPCFLNHTPRT